MTRVPGPARGWISAVEPTATIFLLAMATASATESRVSSTVRILPWIKIISAVCAVASAANMKGSVMAWAFGIKRDLAPMRNNHIMREHLDVELWLRKLRILKTWIKTG